MLLLFVCLLLSQKRTRRASGLAGRHRAIAIAIEANSIHSALTVDEAVDYYYFPIGWAVAKTAGG